MTRRQKMLAGELYDPLDPELADARKRARDLCQALNATRESEAAERRRLLTHLFGSGRDSVWMQPHFWCDDGSKIHLGGRVFFNFHPNCTVLDGRAAVPWCRHDIGRGGTVSSITSSPRCASRRIPARLR